MTPPPVSEARILAELDRVAHVSKGLLGIDAPVVIGQVARELDADADHVARVAQEATLSRNGDEAEAQAEANEDELRSRTLDEIDATPSKPLLLDMLEPDDTTLLYGAGGVGKGMTSTYLMGELIKIGMRPLLYDAERREKEWAKRAEGLGIDRAQIRYVTPMDLPRRLVGKSLDVVVPHLGRIMQVHGNDFLWVDSILAASGVGEERLKSDAAFPYDVARELHVLGKPSALLGHPRKGDASGEPYGSVAWVTAARLTWLGTNAEGEGHRVRWQVKKRNERGTVAAVQLRFSYGEDGRPHAVERLDDERTTQDWVTTVLMQGEATAREIGEAMLAATDDDRAGALERTTETVNRTLRRMRKAGKVHKVGKQRGAPWALGASNRTAGVRFDSGGSQK